MKVLDVRMPQLDWRQPWCWPRSFQYAWFVGASVIGALLLSPWWLQSWQMWNEANAAHLKWTTQQETTQTLLAQTMQLKQTYHQPFVGFADADVLTHLAQQQGLHLSQVGHDKPHHSPALNALSLQELPVHVKVQGSWQAWLNWLAQWPSGAPGVTVSSLELKADMQGGISAQMLAVTPQSTDTDAEFELSSVHVEDQETLDPFSAQAWVKAQRAHAQQHPSYIRLVEPELQRPRELLETFSRERLQYVGHIASNAEVDALVRVLPPVGVKKDAAMMNVHRIRVGQYLGQDFGKVLRIAPDELVVQELVLSPSGEWQTREVRLPLNEGAP